MSYLAAYPAAHATPVAQLPASSVPEYHGMGGLPAIFEIFAPMFGGVITSIFGSKENRDQRRHESSLAAQEAAYRTYELELQKELGIMQLATVDRSIEAQIKMADAKLRAELAAQREQSRTILDGQSAQARAQSAALSAELASQTQAGVFGLARVGAEQVGATARTYPKTGTQAAIVITLGVVAAIAMAGRKKKPTKGTKVGA